jgi:hypothetical protein
MKLDWAATTGERIVLDECLCKATDGNWECNGGTLAKGEESRVAGLRREESCR